MLALFGKTRYSFLFFILLFVPAPVFGQIIKDASLGIESSKVSSPVRQKGKVIRNIKEGAKRGRNLFHSFEKFNIQSNEKINFQVSPEIKNVVVRVVGDSVSNIWGSLGIKSNIDGNTTNFIFLNPYGINFGRATVLDLPGSFLGTTAKSLGFGDDFQFIAQPGKVPNTNKIGDPRVLLLGDQSRDINVAGLSLGNPANLALREGNTLALISSGLSIEKAQLFVPGGHIEFGSIGQKNSVTFKVNNGQWDFDYNPKNSSNPIQISASIISSETGKANGGRIHLFGNDISLSNDSFIRADSPQGVANTGFIFVEAHGLLKLEDKSSIISRVGTGRESVRITHIDAENVQLDNSSIDTRTFVNSEGGDVKVRVQNELLISGGFGQVISASSGSNTAGSIDIEASKLVIKQGGQISNESRETGNGGFLQIKADEISISGTGDGLDGIRKSSITSAATGETTGGAGRISIAANQLSVLDSGEISVSSSNEGGDVGGLNIDATESILVEGQNSFIGGKNQGRNSGGSVRLSADTIQILNAGEISVSSDGLGSAGNLTLNSSILNLGNVGLLSANTNGGQGNISITSDIVSLSNQSKIQTDARGTVPGGNINIDTTYLAGFEDSDISASAEDARGGTIQINSLLPPLGFLSTNELSSGSDIIASSNDPELDGTINIETFLDLDQLLTVVPVTVVDPTDVITSTCSKTDAISLGKEVNSSFSKIGQEGTFQLKNYLESINESKYLNNNIYTLVPNKSIDSQKVTQEIQSNSEAKNWIQNSNGKIELIEKNSSPIYVSNLNSKFC